MRALIVLAALAFPAQAMAQTAAPPPPEHHADPSLTTYSYRVGPFSIGGYQTLRRTDVVSPPPVAGAIVGMDVRIVDPGGADIPQSQLMLHHDVFTNAGPTTGAATAHARSGRCANASTARARSCAR